jgi:HAD superfamily hydrolase (TIGR01459 family)
MSPRPIAGLSEIADRFDGFILDLWGVIHDGQTPYPPAPDTLRKLTAAGKKTLLLSNAPRRAHALVTTMNGMGILRDSYGEVLSSGEATRDALIARDDPFFAALGNRAFHLGPERDRTVFEDTGVEIVDDVAKATFVVNTGPYDLSDPLEKADPILIAARKHNLPMVCANPDIVVIRAGERVVCAGAMAKRYEGMGGRAAYRGKPDPVIYELAIKQLGIADRSRVAVVGDALETDIKGAASVGVPAVWCTGGIHAAALGVSYGVAADPTQAIALAAKEGYSPAYIIPGFYW